MKILLVHNFYRKHLIGGEDVVFRNEVEALKSTLGENNVFVFTVSSDDMSFTSLLKNTFFSVRNYLRVKNIIEAEQIDVLHCHNYFPLLSFSPFLAAKRLNVATILTLHNFRLWCASGTLFRENHLCHDCLGKGFGYPGIRHRCYHNSYFHSLMISLSTFLYRRHLKKVDAFFALSAFQRTILLKYKLIPAEKIVIKPNLVRSPGISSGKAFTPSTDVTFVGKLEDQKGIRLIFDIFRTKLQHRTLRVIGDGPLRTTLEREKSSNIEMSGSLPNEDVLNAIRNSKFLIQPSLIYETFGLTIVEAMSVGIPVLGFPIGTRQDLILDRYNGFLMSMADPAKSIEEALSVSAPHYQQMQRNSIESAKKFHLRPVIDEQIKLYYAFKISSNPIPQKKA